MLKNVSFTELEDIYNKYERLQSLIGILQTFIAEVVEVAGAPSNSIANALFEIELEIEDNNEKLKNIFSKEGGVMA